MKKNYLLSLLFASLVFGCMTLSSCGGSDDDITSPTPTPQSAFPDRDTFGNLKISAINFPDDMFRNYLLTQDYGADEVLTNVEIAKLKEISVPGKNIKNLKGIENFTALEYLDCSNNQLTSLDVSKNIALTNFICNNNQLTSLDVSKNIALTNLICNNNQLTSLDVSKNTILKVLDCRYNKLTSIDLSNNTMLEILRYDGGDSEQPTYVEPTYTQHESPQWNNVVNTEKPSDKYPTDLTAYIQLPDSIRAYASSADQLAAFCGSECRGNGTLVDGVWCIRIWGNVADNITLKYYCATNKYMYHSAEFIVLKDDEHLGTYDEPRTVYFIVEK